MGCVETVFTGGMTMAPTAMQEVERRFDAPLAITFGMTETCGTALMTGRERLASFKLPRQWAVVDDLPRTASGKVQRALLCQS